MYCTSQNLSPYKHIKYLTFMKYNVLIGEAELSKLKVDLDEVNFFKEKKEVMLSFS